MEIQSALCNCGWRAPRNAAEAVTNQVLHNSCQQLTRLRTQDTTLLHAQPAFHWCSAFRKSQCPVRGPLCQLNQGPIAGTYPSILSEAGCLETPVRTRHFPLPRCARCAVAVLLYHAGVSVRSLGCGRARWPVLKFLYAAVLACRQSSALQAASVLIPQPLEVP